MLVPRTPLSLLGVALGSFVVGAFCGSSLHSLCYFYLKLPEPNQQLPQFFIKGYLDDQPISRFDSLTGKMEPLVPWMEEVEKETFLPLEWVFRNDLEKLSNLDHQAEGLHTWQVVLGCELWEDGSKGWFFHYGYNGMDFISFDKETLRWVAAQPQAQKVKENWDYNPGWSNRNKVYLEETCVEWLQRYLSYQNKTLKRTEPPVGKVSHKVVDDSLEVLICQAFGFYPKEIQATWMRDGEVCQYKTLHRNVAPNSDGTYYVHLSIEIDPKEKDHFWCHLEHEGFQEPLVLAWKEETAKVWQILVEIGAVVIPGAVILFLIGRWWRFWKNRSQQVNSYFDYIPSKMAVFPSLYGTENGIQSQTMLQFKETIEKPFGGGLPQRAFKATQPTLSRQEGKQQSPRKWNSWDGGLQAQAEAGAAESGVRKIRQSVENLGSQGSGDSEGFHSCQSRINCELSEDGHKQGGYRNSCDVEDLISWDRKSHTSTAAYLHALVTKMRTEDEPATCACSNVVTECHELKGGGMMGGEMFGENRKFCRRRKQLQDLITERRKETHANLG